MCWRVALCIATLFAAARAQTVTTDFATGTAGWLAMNTSYNGHITLQNVSTQVPQWDTVVGQPAPSIRLSDLFGETGIAAPAPFLGDKLAWFGGTVSWDILVRTTDGVTYPAVWLVGATKTLVFNRASPPLGSWQTCTVPLVETGWRVNGWQGVAATRADMMEVLADLRGLLLNTEWMTGPDDTSVDNVVLARPTTGATCFGAACRGSNGRWPTTWIGGSLTAGASVSLQVTDGAPGALAIIVVGFGQASTPILGCTAWIVPSDTIFPLTLDLAGAASMTAAVPMVPPGPLAALQSVVFDAAAPAGFGIALTNAVAVTVQ